MPAALYSKNRVGASALLLWPTRQNLFFTIVARAAYGVVLGTAMGVVGEDIYKFVAFPALPAGLISVIAVSNAGYLIDKALVYSVPAEQA